LRGFTQIWLQQPSFTFGWLVNHGTDTMHSSLLKLSAWHLQHVGLAVACSAISIESTCKCILEFIHELHDTTVAILQQTPHLDALADSLDVCICAHWDCWIKELKTKSDKDLFELGRLLKQGEGHALIFESLT
jgi:hypothetical protein